MTLLLNYLDLLWLGGALYVARPDQRGWVAGFFILCMILMRLMVEFMESLGYPNGIMGLLGGSVLARGVVLFSLVYAGYIAYIRYYKGARGVMLMGTSLAIFFAVFVVFAGVMVL